MFKIGTRLLCGGLGLTGCVGAMQFTPTNMSGRLRIMSVSAQGDPFKANSIYEFSAKNIDGEEVSLEKYDGRVCVVVNVASKWGKTRVNYTQLVELHKKYSETGVKLAILAFPCNQFGSQEPGTNAEIKKFAAGYGVKFDMFDKIDVNGKNAHPLWIYLKEKEGGLLGSSIKWNFTKFIIDKEGKPVARLGPMDDPIPKVENVIKSLES